jgi:hypothetical protein
MIMPKPALVLALSIIVLGTACQKNNMNKMPVADAGPSQTVELPTDGVTLSGSGKDADGKVVTYLWEQVSGPSASLIVDPGSPTTVVQGFVRGTYTYQLSVFDDEGGIGTDTTMIIVNGVVNGTTITLQPNANPYEMNLANYDGSDATGLTQVSLEASAWTENTVPITIRGLVEFDLSSIPSGATVGSAHLYLYSNPTPNTGNFIDANFGPDNSFAIRQVSTPWSPNSVSWFNAPSVRTDNEVVVPSTDSSRLDLNIDVTAQVASMVKNSANYGFMLQLQSEVTYTSRIFVASHNTTYPDKHPKLVVVYN